MGDFSLFERSQIKQLDFVAGVISSKPFLDRLISKGIKTEKLSKALDETFEKSKELLNASPIPNELKGIRRSLCYHIKNLSINLTSEYITEMKECGDKEELTLLCEKLSKDLLGCRKIVVQKINQMYNSKIDFATLDLNLNDIETHIEKTGRVPNSSSESKKEVSLAYKRYKIIKKMKVLPEELSKEVGKIIGHKTLMDKISDYFEYMFLINKIPSAKSQDPEELEFGEFKKSQKKTFSSRKSKLNDEEKLNLRLMFITKKVG